MNVRGIDQAVLWLQAYAAWEARWDGFLRHRTYAKAHVARPPSGVSDDQQWWYTHRDLRKTRGLFRRLIACNHLFTWIDPELTDDEHPLQRTTSPLEGGPNKAIKDLFRTHRGLPVEHARRAAEWKLNSLTAEPPAICGLWSGPSITRRPARRAATPPRTNRSARPWAPTSAGRTETVFNRVGRADHAGEPSRHTGSRTHILAYNPSLLICRKRKPDPLGAG